MLNSMKKLGFGGCLIIASVVTTAYAHWHALNGIPVPFITVCLWVLATVSSFVWVLIDEADGPTTLDRLRLVGVMLCAIIVAFWFKLEVDVVVSILLIWRWADILLMCKNWKIVHASA